MTADVETRRDQLIRALEDVEDPEIPISIVDMGLVVDLAVDGRDVLVKVTFTAMGCPAMDMIIEDIQERLRREPDIDTVQVEVVWEPIWTKDRLTDEGKMAMREYGISL
jgi:phenylacetate-CoA oxygenase PaaJ subunit